jgi:hypothetical protein
MTDEGFAVPHNAYEWTYLMVEAAVKLPNDEW